ncbi:MAG: peptide ABC transporter substrate-binding protein [Alkalispirochaeta sp.]
MKQALLLGGILVLTTSFVCAGGAAETGSRQLNDFVIGTGAEPQSLDPHQVSTIPEQRVLTGLFEGLVTSDPETARAVPAIAETWEIGEDRVTYTFTLREEVRWSDGSAITAEQIVESWLRILAPQTASPTAWFPAMFIAGGAEFNAGEIGAAEVAVRAIDERTFQFETVEPVPFMIEALTHHAFVVVPVHAIDRHGDKWTQPEHFVGNGPFLRADSPQENVVLEPNPAYWNAGTVELDRVTFVPGGDDTERLDMYEDGEIDWVPAVPADQHAELAPREDYHVSPALGTYYYVLNTDRAPLDDPDVRRALTLALDRRALVDAAGAGGQIPTSSLVPDMQGYPGITGARYDVQAARELLSDAGYPGGQGFPRLTVLYNTDDGHRAIAESLQSQWLRNLGIDVNLQGQGWSTYLDRWRSADFDIIRAGWTGTYRDPTAFLNVFATGDAMNGGRYRSDRYDHLLAEAARRDYGADRFALLQEAEQLLVEDHAAVIPIYHYVHRNLIDREQWSGWYPNVMGRHPVGRIAPREGAEDQR